MAIKTYRYKLSPPKLYCAATDTEAPVPISAEANVQTVDYDYEEASKDKLDAWLAARGWEFVQEVV